MRVTSVAIAVVALLISACGNNEIDVNKSRPISSPPSTPSSALESMSGKVDEATDSAMDAAKETATDTVDAAEEMVADADGAEMMDKAKEMAEDSGVMEKAEEMVADAGGADIMDKAKEAGSSFLVGGGSEEAAEEMVAEVTEEAVEEAPAAMAAVSMDEGKALGNKSGCFACHNIDRKVLGPAWKDVAAKYADDKVAGRAHLLNKIAKGGKGVWADQGINAAMPPYSPRVSDENIEILTDFILSL